MGKKFFLTFIFVAALVMNVPTASAHILGTSGSMAAILHIEPGDEKPVAHTASTVYFLDLGDTGGRFRLVDCLCYASVAREGQVLTYQRLNTSTVEPNFPFTFPSEGTYVVQLSGTPQGRGEFAPFTITWNLSIAPVAPAADESGGLSFLASHVWYIVPLAAIFWLVIFLFDWHKRTNF